MSQIVTMPQLGETVTEGTILTWLVKVGDEIKEDDPIVEISTDKVDTEVPSPFSGVVSALLVEEGVTVEVGTPLLELKGDSKSSHQDMKPKEDAPVEKTEKDPILMDDNENVLDGNRRVEEVMKAEGIEPSSAEITPKGKRSQIKLSPVVRKLLAKHNIDIHTVRIEGTGKNGRITR